MTSGRVIAPDVPIGSIISFAVAGILTIASLIGLCLIVLGIVQFVLYFFKKDKLKTKSATKRILQGVGIFFITVVFFILINVIISSMAIGHLGPLKIPTQTELQNTNPR